VHQVLDDGLDSFLVPRMSTSAAAQVVAATALAAHPDKRSLPLCARPDGGLETSALYKLCTLRGEANAHANFGWQSFAPSKVKVFAWLLVRGRIQSRSNLLRKGDPGCCGQRVPHLHRLPRDPEPHLVCLRVCSLLLELDGRHGRR
jgi:hypothetical protein